MMNRLNGVLLLIIMFFHLACEHANKKSSPKKIQSKGLMELKQKAQKHSKTEKLHEQIKPSEVLPVRIDPEPPRPGLLPYYPVDPPVVAYPLVNSLDIQADSVYDFAAIMPEFPGGQHALKNYLQSNLIYPEDAKELGIEGKVFVSFVVLEDGSVQQVAILRGINGSKSCEKETQRLIKSMPNWIPGKNDLGQIIKVRVKIPVVFRLD